jgi:hypothetical protein
VCISVVLATLTIATLTFHQLASIQIIIARAREEYVLEVKKVINNGLALRCLNNSIKGAELYSCMRDFTICAYDMFMAEVEYDGIIVILRAGLPLGMTLYALSRKPLGFVSAKRNHDLSVDIKYKSVPDLKSPLIVDSWIATGGTIKAVCKSLGIRDIKLFGLIATRQALEKIKPSSYVIGVLSERLTDKNYIVPPKPFLPRDGGNDLFNF